MVLPELRERLVTFSCFFVFLSKAMAFHFRVNLLIRREKNNRTPMILMFRLISDKAR